MEIDTTQRRRSVRRPGLWHGRYRSGRLRRWTTCPVADVSLDGAALVVAPGSVTRAALQIELHPVGSALAPITVWADVRHTRRRADGDTLVGVEFRDVRPADRRALGHMIRLFST